MHFIPISFLALCALAGASPVPYSTEANYGSSLSAVDEAGWGGVEPQLDPRSTLSQTEEAQTKDLMNKLFDMWIGHPKNRAQAMEAVMDKVESGAEEVHAEVEKRDVQLLQAGSGMEHEQKGWMASLFAKVRRAVQKEHTGCDKEHDLHAEMGDGVESMMVHDGDELVRE